MAPSLPALTDPIRLFVDSLLPDLILAFMFFTALTYTVLAKRFEHQRPAVAMAASVGMALSIGLVWWEHRMGWSIRDLGSLAVGIAVILLAMILYQGIRQTGGTWAGAGIAFGAAVLVAWGLGMSGPFAPVIIQTVAIVALTIGVGALLLHHHTPHRHAPAIAPAKTGWMPDARPVRDDLRDVQVDRDVGERLWRGLRRTRHQTDDLDSHPEQGPRLAPQIMAQIRAMLPAEGWLTERLADLRARAHRVREGHVEQLDELKAFAAKLPKQARKEAADAMIDGFQKLVGIETRLERLDNAVAENEKRIRQLTEKAQAALAQHDHAKLYELLEQAEKLQHHNGRLFKRIEHTEAKLAKVVGAVAAKYGEAGDA